MNRVAEIIEFIPIAEVELIKLHAGSWVNMVDTKLWLRVMVLALAAAVQLAALAKTVVTVPELVTVRTREGHVGQLELPGAKLAGVPLWYTLEKIVEFVQLDSDK